MKRTTAYGTWILVALGIAGLWGGMYWFYRVPPKSVAPQGYEFVRSGPPQGSIPAISEPTFESVAAADQYLNDAGYGLDVEVDGEHRFYPYQILAWHEIVNDAFGDTPVVIAYSPLTDVGSAFVRSVNGEEIAFVVSDELWNSDPVLVDAKTGSRWIRLYGQAVDGEMAGAALTPISARAMSWNDWKRAYPGMDVLSHETGVTRDYTRNPYGNYASTPAVWFPLTTVDSRLNAKIPVYAVSVGDARAAYPSEALVQVGAVRETIDGVPIEVQFDEELGTAYAYRLGIDGGPADELVVTRGFWFAFAAAFPGLPLYELP